MSDFSGWISVGFLILTVFLLVMRMMIKVLKKRIEPEKLQWVVLFRKIFKRWHWVFALLFLGFGAVHSVIEYLNSGFNLTGILAWAAILILFFTGILLNSKKKKGTARLHLHRVLTVVLLVILSVHIASPEFLSGSIPFQTQVAAQTEQTVQSDFGSGSQDAQKVFSAEELSLYDGKNGNPAYIAYKGIVYDVSDDPTWKNGEHHGVYAGTDLTGELESSPHGDSVIEGLPVVGSLK